jgi:hypothetical protein
MNNLFSTRSPKQNLYAKAFITASSQDIIKETISGIIPEISQSQSTPQYSIFVKSSKEGLNISLYSQISHILTLFKINLLQIEEELNKNLIDKKILLDHQCIELNVFFK